MNTRVTPSLYLYLRKALSSINVMATSSDHMFDALVNHQIPAKRMTLSLSFGFSAHWQMLLKCETKMITMVNIVPASVSLLMLAFSCCVQVHPHRACHCAAPYFPAVDGFLFPASVTVSRCYLSPSFISNLSLCVYCSSLSISLFHLNHEMLHPYRTDRR